MKKIVLLFAFITLASLFPMLTGCTQGKKSISISIVSVSSTVPPVATVNIKNTSNTQISIANPPSFNWPSIEILSISTRDGSTKASEFVPAMNLQPTEVRQIKVTLFSSDEIKPGYEIIIPHLPSDMKGQFVKAEYPALKQFESGLTVSYKMLPNQNGTAMLFEGDIKNISGSILELPTGRGDLSAVLQGYDKNGKETDWSFLAPVPLENTGTVLEITPNESVHFEGRNTMPAGNIIGVSSYEVRLSLGARY